VIHLQQAAAECKRCMHARRTPFTDSAETLLICGSTTITKPSSQRGSDPILLPISGSNVILETDP